MDRIRISTLLALILLSAVGASACSAQGPSGAAGPVVGGEGFSAPPEWRFAPGATVPSYGSDGMVASTDEVATGIGVEILRRGGNAVDAAIATHFALAVVNPEAGNLGGGGFMLVRTPDGASAALDFREKAPLRATQNMFLDAQGRPTNGSTTGHLSSGVPGSVAGMWAAHQRFGTLPWPELVQPAINLAEGIVVHERLAESLRSYESRLLSDPATAAALLPGGTAPRVGDRLHQLDLAETLRRIARDGHDGFYSGRTAELLVAEMEEGDGIIDLVDLEAYQAVWREPIRFAYREHTVLSMPPSSSGGATLAAMLNILAGYDLQAMGHNSADYLHHFAEAAKRAFVDRNTYIADPDFVAQPLERFLSPEYAVERRQGIRASAATPSVDVHPGLGPEPQTGNGTEGEHTTHFSVIDAEGGAVSVTTTLNSLYGNAITVAGAGFLLNNEMDDFTVQPNVPNQFGLVQGEANSIEPGKRMLSAMTPTIVLDPSGAVRLITGSPGGPTIITTVAQILVNVIDFGMDVAAATAAPRVHHQHLPDVLRYEAGGLDQPTVDALRLLGHSVEERPGYSGDTQTISVLPGSVLAGSSDPRRGGSTAGVREEFEVLR